MNASELLRPWKLVTLALGCMTLIFGSYYYDAPDWDTTFSVIQAIETYVTSAWTMRVLMDRRWAWWPTALFAAWFTIDGSYCIYWGYKDPAGLELMRWANFWASLSMYMGMGVIWMWEGSLREFKMEIRNLDKNFPFPIAWRELENL